MRLKIYFANIVSRKTNARFWLLKTILTKQNQKFWYYQPPSYFQLLLLQKKNTIFTGICRGIVKSENLFFINACFLPTLVVVDQYWTRSSRKTRWECIKGLYNLNNSKQMYNRKKLIVHDSTWFSQGFFFFSQFKWLINVINYS